ncbi:MAG: hypothetical protein RR131_06795 [Anaerovorax sp.]
MNNKGRLIHNLMIVLATAMLLIAITIAWFVNWASPSVDSLNFSAISLHVNVTITSEDANMKQENGNSVLVAENLKPGDVLIYHVNLKNKGSAAKVFFGLSQVKNFKKSETPSQWVAVAGNDTRLSDAINVSVWKEGTGGSYEQVGGLSQIIGNQKTFYLPGFIDLAEGATANFQYRVAFVANVGQENGQGGTGTTPTGNPYTEKRMTATFAVTSTLAK